FRIPETFYDALRHLSFTPSLPQLYAFSVVTGYRLPDWLALFDISFDNASAFQASLPSKRTTMLDPRLYDLGAGLSWYEESRISTLGTPLPRLRRCLPGCLNRPVHPRPRQPAPPSHYVKIGSQDASAFPALLPGSIARGAPRLPASQLLAEERAG